MTTVSTAMKDHQHRALRGLAIALSLVVYVAGLAYAGVRSYTLFAATIDPGLLPLAVVGIVALEISAVALPLSIHFWTQPGAQRLAAISFYLADLALIAANAILDAAHHSGAEVAIALQAYGVYILPALPLLCMAGWALLWMLDPASRERDMRESVKAATQEALLSHIQRAVEAADITQAVESAAGEAARSLVSETLGNAPRRIGAQEYSRGNTQPGQAPALVGGRGLEAAAELEESAPALGANGGSLATSATLRKVADVPSAKAHRNGRTSKVDAVGPKGNRS